MHTRAVIILVIATLAGPAWALQQVKGVDGVAVEAIISTREPTRIRVDGAKIIDVVGNIYSSSCSARRDATATAGPAASAPSPVNPLGEFVLGCDLAKGEIYVRPVGKGKKPINLFVSTERATYTLLLRRSDVPADTIVIVDKSPRSQRSAAAGALQGKSAQHVRSVKAMLVALAGSSPGSEYTVDNVNEIKTLWTEVRFEKVLVLSGNGLVGEQYLLTNTSAEVMVLAEQEFDRDGDRVLGVAIENHNLLPGDSTTVYVIRAED